MLHETSEERFLLGKLRQLGAAGRTFTKRAFY
jgi:hypothetical protein